jgi:general secretion pathway protein A
MMYCKHFGLWSAPFKFTPAKEEFFLSTPHREGLAALQWGLLHEPTGFSLFVGEPGTGKTTLIGRVLADYYQRIRCVSVSNPKLSPDEILRTILDQLNVFPKSPGKLDLLYGFETYLHGLRPRQSVAIIIDEAQDLSDDALEELRLLSNLGSTEEKQVRFLLVGHQELLTRLASPGLRHLNERIGARAILNPLQPGEARQYVDYLIATSGGSTNSIFEPDAINHLIQHSGGTPRRINVLCHNALVNAYSQGSKQVTVDIARKTVAEGENILTTAIPFDGNRTANQSFVQRTRLVLSVSAIGAFAALAFVALDLQRKPLVAGAIADNADEASYLQEIDRTRAFDISPTRRHSPEYRDPALRVGLRTSGFGSGKSSTRKHQPDLPWRDSLSA